MRAVEISRPVFGERLLQAGHHVAGNVLAAAGDIHRPLLRFAQLEPTPLELAESLEQLRALEHGIRIRTVVTPYDSIGVDTPEDLERVRQHLLAART